MGIVAFGLGPSHETGTFGRADFKDDVDVDAFIKSFIGMGPDQGISYTGQS